MERNTAGNWTEQEIKTVTFNVQDRMTYGVLGYDRSELMAVISGYDLEIKFNMRLINSLADAEACADALADKGRFHKAFRQGRNATLTRRYPVTPV